MNNNRSKENTKHTNIRTPIELYEKIEKLSKENRRSITQQIIYMLEDWIKIKEK